MGNNAIMQNPNEYLVDICLKNICAKFGGVDREIKKIVTRYLFHIKHMIKPTINFMTELDICFQKSLLVRL